MLTRTAAQVPDKLTLTIEASDASPIVDPAIVIKTGEKDQLVWISKASRSPGEKTFVWDMFIGWMGPT